MSSCVGAGTLTADDAPACGRGGRRRGHGRRSKRHPGGRLHVRRTGPRREPAAVDQRHHGAGSAPRKPAQYASLGESVNVSVTVSDAESTVDQMTLTWSSDVGGSFSGSGANVTWTAPGELSGTPRTATLTLTVTERYNTTDTSGLPVTAEHRVTGTSAVRLHNSIKEVSDLASQFLLDFSRQLDPAIVMRNFTPNCAGHGGRARRRAEQPARTSPSRRTRWATPATRADFTGQLSVPQRVRRCVRARAGRVALDHQVERPRRLDEGHRPCDRGARE